MMMQPFVRPPRAGYAGEQDPDLLRSPRGWLSMVGRLEDGVPPEQARAELVALLAGAGARHAAGGADGRRHRRAASTRKARRNAAGGWLDRLAARRDRRRRAADRVRQHRESAADEGGGAPARVCGAARDGRVARPARPSAPRREPDDGAAGRRARRGARVEALAAVFRAAPPPAGALPFAVDFAIDCARARFSRSRSRC